MPYFLAEEILETGKEFKLAGEEGRHLSLSIRAKKGDKFKIQDTKRQRFLCEVVSAAKGAVTFRAVENLVVPRELDINLSVFVAVVSGRVMEDVLEKAEQFGVQKLIFFNSEYSPSAIKRQDFEKKQIRFQKIIRESAKQCERAGLLEVGFQPGLKNTIEDLMMYDKVLVLDKEGSGFNKVGLINAKKIALVVGPEGGFSQSEMIFLKNLPNADTVCLGNFVLKTETAAAAGMAMVANLFYC